MAENHDMENGNLELMKEYFDRKFEALERKAKAENAANKIEPVLLKNKGNQSQINHELKVLKLLHGLKADIKNGESEEALQKVKTATKEVEKRVKLIKLADKSDCGWSMVAEYESDELASDSDDDRRIAKAESAAQQKKRKREGESSKKRFAAQDLSNSSKPRTFFRAPYRAFNPQDTCYACGMVGHWRQNCPNVPSIKRSYASPAFGPRGTGTTGFNKYPAAAKEWNSTDQSSTYQ